MTEYDPSIYDAKFYASRKQYHKYAERYMKPVAELFSPYKSILDLGAGDGHLAATLGVLGGGLDRVRVFMLELSPTVLPYIPVYVTCRIHDLREPVDYEYLFDVVMCIEVAEHLPESAADTLCDTIAKHVRRYLLFTAAPPGQRGRGHVNCQPPEYWMEKFEDRGLGYRKNLVRRLRAAWKGVLKPQHRHLARNVQIWEG